MKLYLSLTVLQARFGNGIGGLVLMAIPLITTLNSTVLSLTTNARYAHAWVEIKQKKRHQVVGARP